MKLNSPPPSDPILPPTLESTVKNAERSQTPALTEQNTPSGTANPLSQGDQTTAQTPASHNSEANRVHFDEPAASSDAQQVSSSPQEQAPPQTTTQAPQAHVQENPSAKSPASSQQKLEQLQAIFRKQGESAYADPAVLKLLDYVREQEDKNVKQMLDMLQQSLDRAHEMMEQNKEDFYKKTLPHMQKVEQAVQQMQNNQEALQTQQIQQANHQIASALQSAQTQLSQVPIASPQLAQAQSELAFANLLSTLL